MQNTPTSTITDSRNRTIAAMKIWVCFVRISSLLVSFSLFCIFWDFGIFLLLVFFSWWGWDFFRENWGLGLGNLGWLYEDGYQWDYQISSTSLQMLHPIIKWAQRKDRVFIEVQLRDVTEEKITLTETTISFEGISDKTKYSFDFELFASISTEESKWTKTGFHLLIVLEKKEQDKPFWSRITKATAKNQYIQIDWAKWVDEDEEADEGDKGLGGFDPSQMQGFPGMGGMGGMPGMGGMGGMGGFEGMGGNEDDEEEGNIDDLDKPEEVEDKPAA